jgi:hypothetical protein
MAAFQDFTRRELAEDDQVREFRSMLVLRHSKEQGALPLSEEQTA